MKKSKLLIPLIPLSVGSLTGIAIPLSSCGCGGSTSDTVSVVVQCDEHCRCSRGTSEKVAKGKTWSSIKYDFGLTFDEGYSELGAYVDGQQVLDSYVINSNVTIQVKSCLTSDKVTIHFGETKHCSYQETYVTVTGMRSQKWSEVAKPTVIADEGYTFENIWFSSSRRISDDTTIDSLVGSSSTDFYAYPHIKSTNPTAQSNFTYTLDTENKTARITGLASYSFEDRHLNIPSTITEGGVEYKVTSVYFSYSSSSSVYEVTLPDTIESIDQLHFSNLYKVNLPESVTSIGSSCFSGCTALESITLPSKLKYIGSSAFNECKKITSITIPASVTDIEGPILHNCDSLTSIVVDKANTVYTSRNSAQTECNCIVKNEDNLLLQACATTVIPSTVTTVKTGAFTNIDGLTSITIPASVTSFQEGYSDSNPFENCSNLKSIIVEDGNTVYSSKDYSKSKQCNILRKLDSKTIQSGCNGTVLPDDDYEYTIGSYAFAGLTGLTSIGSSKITTVNSYAFSNCTALTSVDFSGVTSLGTNAFSGCSNLTSIDLSSMTSIPESEFYNCSNLTNVKLSNISTIGNGAFCGCSKLANIDLSHVTKIGTYAFENCTSLPSIDISNITYSDNLGSAAFRGCKGLTSIKLSTSLTSIPTYCFKDCENATLTGTTFENFTSIGQDAFSGWKTIQTLNVTSSWNISTLTGFSNCSNLTSVTISSTKLSTIGKYAFNGCKALTSVDFGSSPYITTIDEDAFYGCSALTNITLPRSLKTIGASAFCGCSELTSIIVPENVTSIGGSAFSSCSKVVTISLPNSLKTIGSNAFYNTSITSASIPDSVESVGYHAFYGCQSLTQAWIGKGVTSMDANIFGDCPLLTSIKVSTSNTKYTSRSEVTGSLEEECNYIASKRGSGTTKILYSTCLNSTISSDITGLGKYAFSGYKLTAITIPSQITYIAENAIDGSNIKSITLQATFTEWPEDYSKDALNSIGYEGTFNAPNSTVSSLVKTNWKKLTDQRWTFNC